MKTIRCPLALANAPKNSKQQIASAPMALMKIAATAATSFALGLSIVVSLGSSLVVRTEPQQIALKAERPAEIRSVGSVKSITREIASVQAVKAVKESAAPGLAAKLAN